MCLCRREPLRPTRDFVKENSIMSPIAKALLNALLAHLHASRAIKPPGPDPVRDSYTIGYGQLIERAKVPIQPINVSPFLLEVAEWCSSNNYKALHSLAVSVVDGRRTYPGDGYDGAGGFLLKDWDKDVVEAILFTGFPKSVP
jgi:hypothetical protein